MALRVEQLEGRRVMAVTVTVGATLAIVGDAFGDAVVIQGAPDPLVPVPGQVLVTIDTDGDQVVDTTLGPYPDVRRIAFTGKGGDDSLLIDGVRLLGSITVHMGEGNDAIQIDRSLVEGALIGNLGPSDDSLEIDVDHDDVETFIRGNISLVAGDGDDRMGTSHALRTLGAATIHTGSGNDSVGMLVADRDISLHLGTENDLAGMYWNDGVKLDGFITSLHGDIVLRSVAGEDCIGNITSGRSVTIDTGTEDDEVTTVVALVNISISTGHGDDLVMGDLAGAAIVVDTSTGNDGLADIGALGNVLIRTGSGDDSVDGLVSLATHTLLVDTADGNDSVTGLATLGAVSLNTSSGNDTIDVELAGSNTVIHSGTGNDVVTLAMAYANVSISLGTGNDVTFVADSPFIKALALDAGSGNDAVSVDFVAFALATSVRMGAGVDTLSISNSQFARPVTVDGGSDFDGFANAGGNTFASTLTVRNFES